MASLAEIETRLTGPGGPFETIEERVLGETLCVFKNRAPSLRSLLADSAARGSRARMSLNSRSASSGRPVEASNMARL